MSETRLFYIYDPMCSWCYAFADCWLRLQSRLPAHIHITYVLGGLAPDTDVPMPDSMRTLLQQTWRKIEKTVPGVRFNFDFWTDNTPRRSTYPACRAVLAARRQRDSAGVDMLRSIQSAYYQLALNPSLSETLIQCAHDIGLDAERFKCDLGGLDIDKALQAELRMVRALRVLSFPALRIEHEEKLYPINVNYLEEDKMLDEINAVIASETQ